MGRSGHRETDDRREAALALIAQGELKRQDIAAKLGVSRQTLSRWVREDKKKGGTAEGRDAAKRTPDAIIETYEDLPKGGWPLLPLGWDKAREWVQALNDGATTEEAADMCGIEREEPDRWERLAEDEPEGSELGEQARSWRRVTRKRMTRLKLVARKRLLTASYGHEVTGAKILESILASRTVNDGAGRSAVEEIGLMLEQEQIDEEEQQLTLEGCDD